MHFALNLFLLIILVAKCFGLADHPTKPPVGCPNYALCIDNNYDTTNTMYYDCEPNYCGLCNDGTADNLLLAMFYTKKVYACASNTTNKCVLPGCVLGKGMVGPTTCTNYINNYDCQCQSGWTGTDCTQVSTICDSSPCRNGGTCTPLTATTFKCDCGTNAMGERCQYENICANSPCVNGACVMLFSGEKSLDQSNLLSFFLFSYCNCTSGWQGAKCDTATLTNADTTISPCIKIKAGDTNSTVEDMGKEPSASLCRSMFQTEVIDGATYKSYCVAGKKCYMYTTFVTDGGNSSLLDDCATKCNQEATPKGKTDYPGANEICGMSYSPSAKNPRGPCYNYADISKQACVPNPCHGSVCRNTTGFNFYECDCKAGWTGQDCDIQLHCQPADPADYPCKYGGMCVEKSDSPGFTCECLSRYTGDDCSIPNMCRTSLGLNPCINGNCSINKDGFNSTYECTCEAGWTGQNCDIYFDFCNPQPCLWGGSCSNYRPLGIPTYPWMKCDCQPGTFGDKCETNPDNCPVDKCNATDKAAKCIDGFDDFTCVCSPDYTNKYCDIPVIVYDAIRLIFGEDATVSDDVIQLLKDLVSNPTNIKDMVPFILGLETEDERGDKSWDYNDMFKWVAYEERTLNLQQDLLKWNDVTLGNCFTFNHRNNTKAQYLARMSGKAGSLEAMLSVNSEENCPWIDTEAIQVFVHPAEEDIFSESVRYNAQPGGEAELFPKLTAYQRLGGRYGRCVTETSQVKQYFYSGSYATDGCLRSCYQQAVLVSCSCMDPRYPMDKTAKPCPLEKRKCVEDLVAERGDPSKWKDCVCPLPCANRAYTVSWTKSVFTAKKPQCAVVDPTFNTSACISTYKDTVRVRVLLPDFGFQLFEEVPVMSFNSFIGNLGGLLGVLMGISTISFIEIGFLFLAIIVIVLGCKKTKK
ncbi:unnamed protein product, partial [Mesorhabditis belari]|uniref:EGF-like domain-containing protein n=1 Tax=Mesorhabditis belari TaxID=2138241 RepID=A0AAF3FA82_9BILA